MEKKADTVVNSWVGVDVSMSENGEEVIADKDAYKEFTESTVDKDFKLSLYSDGAGDFT